MATAEKIDLDNLQLSLTKRDVFICSSSFEERCYKIPEALRNYTFKNVFICRNSDQLELVDKYAIKIKNFFRNNSCLIDIASDNPIKTADEIIKAFNTIESKYQLNYLIDITTFTHEALLILLVFLRRNLKSVDTVNFVYLPAKEYSKGDANEEKWLSRGISSIRSVLGYPGTIVPSNKTHLIILMGFEPHRAAELIEVFEPDVISIGSPTEADSVNTDHYQILIRKHIEFNNKIKNIYNNITSFNFSCIEVDLTVNNLNQQVNLYNSYNTIIAPLNNKVSTLGVAMYAFKNPDVQICYTAAETYNTLNYAVAEDYCYRYNIDDMALKLEPSYFN